MGHEVSPARWLFRVFTHWADATLAGALIVGPIYGVFFATVLAGPRWETVGAGLAGGLVLGLYFVALPAMVLAGTVGAVITARSADVHSREFEGRVKRGVTMVLGAVATLVSIALLVFRDPSLPQVRLFISVLMFPVAVVAAVHIFSRHPIRVTREIASGNAHAGWRRLSARLIFVLQVVAVGFAAVLLLGGGLALIYNTVYLVKGDGSALRWIGVFLVIDLALASLIWVVIAYGRRARRHLSPDATPNSR